MAGRFRFLLFLPALRLGTHSRLAVVRAFQATALEISTTSRGASAHAELAIITPSVFDV